MVNRIKEIIEKELVYFVNEEIINSFKNYVIVPYKINKTWNYGSEFHECWVIAESTNDNEQIVYCETGFGPDFPWGRQLKNENDMGRDDVWFAYLFEAFISSSLWNGSTPEGFELMGPGERKKS